MPLMPASGCATKPSPCRHCLATIRSRGSRSSLDPDKRQLTVEDNGIGMSRDEMVEALGTIARSGTKAFLDRIEAAQADEETALIGRFGVGFYSAFMVADRVEVISRRAGSDMAFVWSSDGKGSSSVAASTPWPPKPRAAAPAWSCI